MNKRNVLASLMYHLMKRCQKNPQLSHVERRGIRESKNHCISKNPWQFYLYAAQGSCGAFSIAVSQQVLNIFTTLQIKSQMRKKRCKNRDYKMVIYYIRDRIMSVLLQAKSAVNYHTLHDNYCFQRCHFSQQSLGSVFYPNYQIIPFGHAHCKVCKQKLL